MVDRSDGFSGDTTALTKIFVGGLAWETKRDTMRRYFEQFGEILEAVVISDKNTGRSKGYGFVTFRDPESAKRACENRFPVIDGRRANCNLASLGARKNRPTATSVQGGYYGIIVACLGAPASLVQVRSQKKNAWLVADQLSLCSGSGNNAGMERLSQKPPPAAAAEASSSSFDGHSTYFHQTIPHGSYPYSYGYYPGYSQDFFLMGYYSVYGRQQQQQQQQLPPYYPSPGSGMASHGFYPNCYPYYAHPGPSLQYLKSVQYPFLFQQFHNTLSVPSSALPLPTTTARVVNVTAAVGPEPEQGSGGNVSEQKSTA